MRHRSIRLATGLGIVVAVALVAAHLFGLRAQEATAATHAAGTSAMVALTFDDGLNGEVTSQIAEILERYEARGTFFVVGETLAAQVPVARRLLAREHLLANHSYSHQRAARLDLLYSELPRAQAAFDRAVGLCPRYYRPPYGKETEFTKAAVRRAGMHTALWDVEVRDWAETAPERLAENVLRKVRPGSIVLLHDGQERDRSTDRSVLLAALPMILEGLEARGLSAVRLDVLLDEPGYIDCR